jgi:2-C-methyl-D-erythritol 2,4-cyclodiphosphate synthase
MVMKTHNVNPWPELRVGEGWDTHALVPGRALVLGGVTIPFERGLLGHSDADALLHALTDALLGAAGLGDIGAHFPDTDARFKGADSTVLLAEALRSVRALGWGVMNVDSTVVAQQPRMAQHLPAMKARIAEVLGIDVGRINIKAKTAERMGPVGRGEAIETRAVCMLVREAAPAKPARVRIQAEDFDLSTEVVALRAEDGHVGAVVSFVGTVRGEPGSVLALEHYPGMTERSIEALIDQAIQRFGLHAARVIHRIGPLGAQEQIVWVGAAAAHRGAAFQGCEYLMDYLKTQAPFWKKATAADGSTHWVDARVSDDDALKRWAVAGDAW